MAPVIIPGFRWLLCFLVCQGVPTPNLGPFLVPEPHSWEGGTSGAEGGWKGRMYVQPQAWGLDIVIASGVLR